MDAWVDPAATETIPQLVRATAAAYGHTPAVVRGDEILTYDKLDRHAALLGRALLGAGVAKGTRMGLLLGNGPDWVTWWAAVSRIGAVAVPLSTFYKTSELRRVIRHADLHALVFQHALLGQDFVAELEAALPGLATSDTALRLAVCPYLRWCVAIDDQPPRWARDVSSLTAGAVDDAILEEAEREVHPDDPALVIYTSGQSADPKGVVHSHSAVVSKAHYLREMFGFERDTEIEATMPFFWVGGLVMALLPGLEVGAVVSCQDRSQFGVQNLIRSGAPVENPFADAPLVPSLGMTETFGMYSWGRTWRASEVDLAPPLDVFAPGVEVKVIRPDGSCTNEGEAGEIAVRGGSLTLGLVKARRADVFDSDGFYRTGDGGYRRDGRIHFTGRLDDMIKTSGANVSPAEVENELRQLPGVQDAFVTALDDPERGQEVVAAVVAAEGSSLSARELREGLRSRMSAYKVPRRIALIEAHELPVTPSMKVKRRELAALIAERSDAGQDRPTGTLK